MTLLKKTHQKRRLLLITACSVLLLVLLTWLLVSRQLGMLEMSILTFIAGTLSALLYSQVAKLRSAIRLDKHTDQSKMPTPQQETNTAFPDYCVINNQSGEVMEDLEVVLVSTDMNLVSQICRNLDAWKKRHTVCSSGVQAISLLKQLTASTSTPISCSLIVDGRHPDADQLLSKIRDEVQQVQLKNLYLYDPNREAKNRALLKQGYDGVISLQTVIPQLFSYLQNDDAVHSDNIISFAGYRREQFQDRSSKAILLAEQHSGDRRQLQNTLRKAGHKVISVADGDQALEALEHQSFDLAIINLELPIMNGTQVIRLHRFTTAYRQQVPFIVITSNDEPNSLRICRDLHIQACLFKPVHGPELLDCIDDCLTSAEILSKRTGELKSPLDNVEDDDLGLELLDKSILDALEKFDDEQQFIKDLMSTFENECGKHLKEMQTAMEMAQIDRFRSVCNSMTENAGQLGALALQKASSNVGHINNHNLLTEGERLIHHLKKTCSATSRAFEQYLKEKRIQHIHHI